MKKNRLKKFSLLLVVLFIGIGYAFLSTNLEINGISIMKRSVWDLHFENIVDDYEKAVIDIPASISRDRLSVNFEVTLNNPGDEYYFYVDVVNDGTIDVMLNNYLFSGLTTEQEKLISTTLTYNDGVAVNKYDLLKENSFDTLKVAVKFREDIEVSDLPSTKSDFNLSLEVNFDQADENAREREHIADVTPPRIKFIKVNDNSGNDEWSKDIRLLVKIVDESKIKEAKYCITTPDNECEPDQTPEELQNTSFYFTFPESDTEQRLCVKATDTNDNTKTTCTTESYLVDGEDPIIKNVNLTKETNSITVEVDAEDKQSGIYMYYYSKDSGETYIPSIYPNYTFTGLDNDDYFITFYTEDVAGNKSAVQAKTSTIRNGDWCKKNNLTTLGDCLLGQEARDSNIVQAKTKIESKEQPSFSKMSPQIEFGDKEDAKSTTIALTTSISNFNSDGTRYSSSYYKVGDGYTIDPKTGYFNLKNIKNTYDFEELDYQNNNYYVCNNSNNSVCTSLYKIISADFIEETRKEYSFYTTISQKYSLLKYTINKKSIGYDSKETGIYATEDDLGTSYYYRGAVEGNIVKFGNYYWKIMRINGDGTIRMIYYGTSPSKYESITTTNFNIQNYDPTYVGLKYNDDFDETPLERGETNSAFGSGSTYNYYFSRGYTYDPATKKFSLNIEDGNFMTGIWEKDHEQILNEGYIYTCMNTSATAQCRILMQLTRYSYNEKYDQHNYFYKRIMTASSSYEEAVQNKYKSILLQRIDEWYETNIKDQRDSSNNLLSDYLADGIFCNDRRLNSGNGFNPFSGTIYYDANRRIGSRTPQLTCTNQNDRFTEADTVNGNGALDYKIATLTADELSFAGGINDSSNANNLFYLYSDSGSYWTMTPNYNSTSGTSHNYHYSNGYITSTQISNSRGIRPVINLKANTKIVSGEGTIDSPFEITLGN